MASRCVPSRGDADWILLNPQVGHEQAGRRPALVVSPLAYNKRVGLAILCPIMNQVKGCPFEAVNPPGSEVTGAVLSDQVKCLDWRERQVELTCRLQEETVVGVIEKLHTLPALDEPSRSVAAAGRLRDAPCGAGARRWSSAGRMTSLPVARSPSSGSGRTPFTSSREPN